MKDTRLERLISRLLVLVQENVNFDGRRIPRRSTKTCAWSRQIGIPDLSNERLPNTYV
jgi:hypothetical protein